MDRSRLSDSLMLDKGVTFHQGDAFTFSVEGLEGGVVDWMVCDVAAYPERVSEMIERWCGVAKRLVITMKFRGPEPDWACLEQALAIGRWKGYHARAKHFFNNKNEVTLMLRARR